jgi:hypothetical protein
MHSCRVPFFVALAITAPACAQPRSGPAYETDMKASMMLLSFDALAAKCDARGGFAGANAAAVMAWKSANAVDAMRNRAQTLQADPTSGKDLRTAVDFLTGRVEQSGLGPCAAAVKVTESSEAQFATLIPGLAGKSTPPTARPKPVKGVAAPGPAAPLAGRIDSFGFDTKAGMGMGGFITTEIYPVVLFRDGSALTDVTGLNDPVAHRRANPENWVQWRRSGGKIELMKSSGWKAMRLSGGGTMGVGGDQSVSVVSEYRFWPDGSVVRGGRAGAMASAGSSSVVTSSVTPDARGTYRIDGLTLAIRYDDGSTERRILVADPADPKTAIWLDGRGYVRRAR